MGRVARFNKWHQHRISKLVVKKLFGTVSEKKVAILGFPSKQIMIQESQQQFRYAEIYLQKAELLIHDPKVIEKQIELDLGEQAINNHKNINESDSKLLKVAGKNAIKLISALKMLMQL